MTAMHSLIESNRQAIQALAQKHGASRLWIFGSAAADSFDAESSDVDVLVDFGASPRAGLHDRYWLLKEDLEGLLKRSVDLCEIQAIHNPIFRRKVEATRVEIYAA